MYQGLYQGLWTSEEIGLSCWHGASLQDMSQLTYLILSVDASLEHIHKYRKYKGGINQTNWDAA